jgi:hypothetical protein
VKVIVTSDTDGAISVWSPGAEPVVMELGGIGCWKDPTGNYVPIVDRLNPEDAKGALGLKKLKPGTEASAEWKPPLGSAKKAPAKKAPAKKKVEKKAKKKPTKKKAKAKKKAKKK